jgi:hypothetical protein
LIYVNVPRTESLRETRIDRTLMADDYADAPVNDRTTCRIVFAIACGQAE